jgi:hypothetical protein
MTVIRNIKCLAFASLFLVSGCSWWKTVIDINAMPEQAPKEVQAKFAWGLWNLDKNVVESALAEGAKPFDIGSSIKGLTVVPNGMQLSPYAVPLEKYMKLVNDVQSVSQIKDALDRVAPIFELLIKNKVSVDDGVTTLDGNPSMREFVLRSVTRLQNEKNKSNGVLDEEGEYALATLARIRKHIDEYQSAK